MARRKQAINPFYPLLVIAGVAFAITACAYGIMALKAMTPDGGDQTHPLLVFLDQHGMMLLGGELAVLAVMCGLAMATDSYWTAHGQSGHDQSGHDQSGHAQAGPGENAGGPDADRSADNRSPAE